MKQRRLDRLVRGSRSPARLARRKQNASLKAMLRAATFSPMADAYALRVGHEAMRRQDLEIRLVYGGPHTVRVV